MLFVAEGVHGLPEAVVEEGVDFAFFDETFDGFALEHLGVVGDGVDGSGLEDEESAVDPSALVLGFFLEGVDLGVFEAEGSEAGDGLDAGEGDGLPCCLWKSMRRRCRRRRRRRRRSCRRARLG